MLYFVRCKMAGDITIIGGISVCDGIEVWESGEEMAETINDHFDHEYMDPNQAARMLEGYRPDIFVRKEVADIDEEFWQEHLYDIGAELAERMKKTIALEGVTHLYVFSLYETDLNIAMVG